MNEHSLERLEFPRVTASIAARADCPGAAATIAAARPIADATARTLENRLVAEALRRNREPGEWCHVGTGMLGPRLEDDEVGVGEAPRLDGSGLVEVLGWLEAAERTRHAWTDESMRARFPGLAEKARALPSLDRLRERLAHALEPDGSVSDQASPALKRARAERARGERELEQKLERWARPFGADAYVTRHGERFVALVPAAGFPRRRGLVHDVSGSGQSLFVEPLEACEANNRLIELGAVVVEEERRILMELAADVRKETRDLLALDGILIHLDSLRARARWAAEVGGIAIDPGGTRLRLAAARHPLLAMARAQDVVPLDLELGPAERLLLVSGPNMGGKTVLLKTVGLAVLLSHAGFPVAAEEGSTIPEIDAVLVDLGDEQSLDQGLSTFAAHLRSQAAMVREAGPRTLLLCDELGAGTDPEEGASLGRALIERFASRGAWAVVTTHLGSLKRIAGEIEGVINGSLEFDAQTMTPRFRFLAGIPGASHALAMAERLGLDATVVERARALTPEGARALERLLEDLQALRARVIEERAALEEARAGAERAAGEHREATEHSRRTLEELKRRLTRESEVLLSHARELWQTVQREARRSEKTRTAAAELRDGIRAVEQEVDSLAGQVDEARAGLGAADDPAPSSAPPRPLAVGDRVRVVDLGVEAEVVGGPDAEGRVQLRRGSWSINAQASRLAAVEHQRAGGVERTARKGPGVGEARSAEGSARSPESPAASGGPSATWEVSADTPPLEVDLRGMETDEALRSLDRGLDLGILSGLSELRIIHGVGRGILRAAVERHLKGHPQVASHRLGQVGEGGRGVTIARLR